MSEKNIEKNFIVSQQKLKNGSWHIHTEPSFSHHFFIGVYVKAGSRFEQKKLSGISHFLEHMLFRGSKKNPSFLDLAEKFEQYGGEWNAATGHEHTEYTYLGLDSSAEELIELFSEVIKAPLLLDPEKEKEIILREIEDEMNEFDEFLDLDFHSTELAWQDKGFKLPITGTKKTVTSLTREDLKSYYEKYYTPENMVICTWGGGKQKKISEAVYKSFSFEKKSSPVVLPIFNAPKKLEKPFFKFVKNTDNQYQVQISFYCDGEWSEKTVLYSLICHLLSNGFSSRLSKYLREEKGLVYSISSHLTSFVDRGLLNFSYASTFENFKTTLEEFLIVLHNLKKDGAKTKELKRAKEQETLELTSLAHNPESYSFFLARNKHWNQKVGLEKMIEETRNVTEEALNKEIKGLFSASNCLMVTMGNSESSLEKESKKLIKKYLG